VIDNRILYLVREEIDRAVSAPDVSSRLDELHAEIHALATKVSELEKTLGHSDAGPIAPRTRTRKAPEE